MLNDDDKTNLRTFFDSLNADIRGAKEFQDVFNKPSVTYADLMNYDSSEINFFPNNGYEWTKIREHFEKNENTEGHCLLENPEEGPLTRACLTNYYLSFPDSFVFFNVGSLHKDVFLSDLIQDTIHERLQEDNFRYLFAIPKCIMKHDDRNEFLDELLSYPDKGLVIMMDQRVPLHFISTTYYEDNQSKIILSYEEFHKEDHMERHRNHIRASVSICQLIAANFKMIRNNGIKIATNEAEFASLS